MMTYSYLTDKNFLKQLYNSRKRTTFARITRLTLDEHPLETIEGKIISGSMNVDGNSAVRRTFSLQLAAQTLDLNQFDWSLENKIKLEVGLENTVENSLHPEIIWFPQGIFYISSLSTSIGQTNINISISGKDKMVQLNGELGGTFGQTTILDQVETSEGKEKYPLTQIIYDMLILVGNENFYNIQINDLQNEGLKLLNYLGQDPLYIIYTFKPKSLTEGNYNLSWSRNPDTDSELSYCPYWVAGGSFEELNNLQWIILEDENIHPTSYSRFTDNLNQTQTLFKSTFTSNIEGEQVTEIVYKLIYQINKGDIVGYENTPLIYSEDLIAAPTDTVTNILDKIINMLSQDYEYFYDLEGRFIFQKKQTYAQTTYSPYTFYQEGTILTIIRNQEYQDTIENNELISNISITPGVENIKNDYVIYGESNEGIPIHLRYALQEKPITYKPFRKENMPIYTTSIELLMDELNDSRSLEMQGFLGLGQGILYQEGKRQYLYLKEVVSGEVFIEDPVYGMILQPGRLLSLSSIGWVEITEVCIIDNQIDPKNKQFQYSTNIIKLYITPVSEDFVGGTYSLTLYKWWLSQYLYVDWREILYQMALDYYELGNTDKYFSRLGKATTGYEQYYTDIMGFWPSLYRNSSIVSYTYTPPNEAEGTQEKEEYKMTELTGWNMDMLNYPDSLSFWLDFIDYGEVYERFNVGKIGRRPLVKNDSKVKVVLDPVIPPLLLYNENSAPDIQSGGAYTPIQATSIWNCLGLAPYPKSAKSVMDSELSKGTVYVRALNLSMAPNYSYDVNKTLKIENNKSKLNGEFIVSRLSYPLSYNGMMSLQANEITQSLI